MSYTFDPSGSGPGGSGPPGTDAHGPEAGPEVSTRLEPDFSHVDAAAQISVSLVRTLRIPDDGRVGTVASGLGRLPMVRVADLGPTMPPAWRRRRGIAVPLYQSEAVRLLFEAKTGYPFAVKVLADGVNLVTGRPWRRGYTQGPRNHLVVPGEHHLDGVPTGDGRVRQLAIRPPGSGARGPGSLDDAFTTERLQLVVTPMRPERWRSSAPDAWRRGPGSRPRMHGPDDWDERHTQTCFVRLVPAQCWSSLTRSRVPHPPISRDLYRGAGVPWIESFRIDLEVPTAGRPLRELDGSTTG